MKLCSCISRPTGAEGITLGWQKSFFTVARINLRGVSAVRNIFGATRAPPAQ